MKLTYVLILLMGLLLYSCSTNSTSSNEDTESLALENIDSIEIELSSQDSVEKEIENDVKVKPISEKEKVAITKFEKEKANEIQNNRMASENKDKSCEDILKEFETEVNNLLEGKAVKYDLNDPYFKDCREQEKFKKKFQDLEDKTIDEEEGW